MSKGIYKRRGQKVWSYDFWLSNRRFSGSTGVANKRDAEKILEEERTEARKIVDAEKVASSSPYTVEIAFSKYWMEVGCYLSNAADCFTNLGRLEQRLGEKRLLGSIDNATVADLVAKRRVEGVTNATVNRSTVEPLRAVLIRARMIWGQTVQVIEWKKLRLKEPQERVREARVDEEAKVMNAIRPDYAPLLSFAFKSGCRMAEIVGLTWDKVDFFNRQFTVTGKGDRSRTIPMTEAIYKLLWSLKDDHETAVFTYVACKSRGGRCKGNRYPITHEGLSTEWYRARARSGVTNFRFHDTRHTAATRLVRATGNLKLAQELLGHADIATTARYSHVTNEDLRAGMEAMNPTRGPTRKSCSDPKSRQSERNH